MWLYSHVIIAGKNSAQRLVPGCVILPVIMYYTLNACREENNCFFLPRLLRLRKAVMFAVFLLQPTESIGLKKMYVKYIN